ncbi:MAG: hypothetical protein QW478_08525 [Candidatus Micrarchaeaceae archaeon]
MRYHDIRAAGPSVLKSLFNVDITDMEKKERNIVYGKLMKENDIYKMIPAMLTSISRFLCKEYEGIIYTQDSIITKRTINNTILDQLVLKFKQNWISTLLVIGKDRDSYIALLNSGEVLIKGKAKSKIPLLIAKKLLDFVLEEQDPILKFKRWFKQIKDVNYFLIDNQVFTFTGVEKVTNKFLFDIGKINKAVYWKNLLQFIYPIGLELDDDLEG